MKITIFEIWSTIICAIGCFLLYFIFISSPPSILSSIITVMIIVILFVLWFIVFFIMGMYYSFSNSEPKVYFKFKAKEEVNT
ncbi:hypothetical protein LCGC14_0176010 [marine sediment metagenome]|uniref:Uncharacterized protein n=1 Tax=marine sediment metagenome TaxID=412755 RepID=A0A0F9V7N6_9ZZZZ